jgi:hypothetical protein
MIILKLKQLWHLRKSLQCPSDRRLSGLGIIAKRKIIVLAESEIPFVHSIA